MVIGGLFIVLLVMAALPIFFQERMIYFPFRYDAALKPEDVRPPFLPYTTADGRNQWGCLIEPKGFTPATGERPNSYLVFSGNASTAMGMADYYEQLAEATGCRFYLVDYRGYGFNDGDPNERGLVADALGAYDTMEKAGFFEGGAGVIGHSLGGGVAFALAAERPVGRMVLFCTFTSIADVIAETQFTLYRPFLRNRFENERVLKELCERAEGQRPKGIVLFHGRRDEVIPFAMGERLAACGFPEFKFYADNFAGHGDVHATMFEQIAAELRPAAEAERAEAPMEPEDRPAAP